ncbi:hypothetical protein JTB14_007397 [Gonioctena quinquepunctata]|nr:hypothetical protein JTB14_007397 [Gonioctena quinquepunctata]
MDDGTPNTAAEAAEDGIESDNSHNDLENPLHASDEDDIDSDYEPQVPTLKAIISSSLTHILDATGDGEQHITWEKKGDDEG